MSTEQPQPSGPPPEEGTPEYEAIRRADTAKFLRSLATDLEAGKVPYLGLTLGHVCESEKNCPEPVHFVSMLYLTHENVTGYLTIKGMGDMLADAASGVIQQRAMQRQMQANHLRHVIAQAAGATKQ